MRLLDRALRVVAVVVAAALGGVTGIYEALFSALYWHHTRLPLSPVLALVVNPLLVLFAYWGTGRLSAALAPALPWLVVMLLAADRTREGDLIFAGDNWVALATLFVGSISFGVAAIPVMRATMRRPPAPTTQRF